MSEKSSRTYWGRPVEYSAEFIAHYLERLRKAKGPIDECSPLEELDGPVLQQYAISEKDDNVRAYLVEIIWQKRRPESAPLLARMLNDTSKKVWKIALDGLVVLGTGEALAALKAARASASVEQLGYLDEAIDQIEHPEAWLGIMGTDRKLIMEFAFHNYDEGEEMGLALSTVQELIEITMGGVTVSITLGQAERLLSALDGLSPTVHGSSAQYSGAVEVQGDPDGCGSGNFHLGAGRGRFFMSIRSLENDREAEMDAGAFDRFVEAVSRAAESARHG